MSLYLVVNTRVRVEIRMNEKCSFSHVITGCPKSSILYVLYKFVFQYDWTW